jgi:hypothetical protein
MRLIVLAIAIALLPAPADEERGQALAGIALD